MKLIKTRRLILNRIGQLLAPTCLLSLSLVSYFLGHNFYRINASALLICLPVMIVVIICNLINRYYDDQVYDTGYIRPKPEKLDLVTKDHIFTEKYIFLFVYFLSDYICTYQISTIFIQLIGLNHSTFYTHMPLFFSMIWSIIVHSFCRTPDFNIKYNKILKIVGHLPTDFSQFSPKLILLFCTYSLLYICASAAYTHPLLSQATLITAIALIVFNIKWFINTNYVLYLMLFSSRRFTDFSTLIYQSMNHIKLSYHIPVVPTCAQLISPCIAILYCSAYIISSSRKDSIKNVQPNT